MNRTHIIIGLLIVLVITYLLQTQKRENLDEPVPLKLSNEAIQNIASVYASTTGEAVFNKIKSTNGITGNVTGNVTGDVSGNVTGDVTSKNINTQNLNISSNASDKNKYFVGSTPETTDKDKSQYLYIAPRKEDDKDWDLTKQFEIHKSGDVKINGALINSRILPGEYKVLPAKEWNWPFFGKYASTFFKKSDPNGAYKTFVFRQEGTNSLWFLTYFKIEDRIALYQNYKYNNFKEISADWYFDIP